ncbi:hypothetical protein K1719_039095 [Acacia pycnantha]|nr:hypothetical protein K1719_039095 [Acacia pycnantha]
MDKPSFDGPECIKEIQLKTEKNASISKFFTKKGAEWEGSKPEQRIPSPVKKKKKVKNAADDKQSSLFSYFGKMLI